MKASIIIPTYNRATLLEKTLLSILNQSVTLDEIEVIICDDGSSDNTKNIVKKFKNKLRIHYVFQEDRGFRAAAARNLGIKKTNSPICVFIDSGILLSSKAIENHIISHERHDKNVAVIGYVYGFDDYSRNDEIIEKS